MTGQSAVGQAMLARPQHWILLANQTCAYTVCCQFAAVCDVLLMCWNVCFASRRLAVGAQILAEVRLRIFKELAFTVSAGIAHNKMLAKLLSAQYKPNKQAVLPLAGVAGMMATDVPLRKIRMLGGKFGHMLEQHGWKTVVDVQSVPLSTLARVLQDTGTAEWYCCVPLCVCDRASLQMCACAYN